jgi:Gpi18-like mannosyltransferase
MNKFLPAWIAAAVILFLYSYTQVSLSLALTRLPFLYSIERAFQYIGYFNRPLSALLYICLILALTILYILTLTQIQKGRLQLNTVKKIIIGVSVILLFAYSAFSFDIFNYIFDAKIITFYHQNPYLHKALDFPGDPMLSFMQWTHRTYPYGPFWLVLTVPVSFLGMHFFLPTYFLFKALAVAAYLICVFCIYTIVKQKDEKSAILAAAVFALNPLIIIESLVSAHNDIVMMALLLIAILFLTKNRRVVSLLFFALSILTKFATIFLLPIFLLLLKNKIIWGKVVLVGVVGMLLSVVAASYKSGNFQPWYLVDVLAISALAPRKWYLTVPLVIFSVGSLLMYLPFLYLGNWDAPVPLILRSMLITSTVLGALVGITIFVKQRKKSL